MTADGLCTYDALSAGEGGAGACGRAAAEAAAPWFELRCGFRMTKI